MIKDFSNPNLFGEHFLKFVNSKTTANLLYGSRFSMKSSAIVRRLIKDSYEYNLRCICIRKTYASLEESVYTTFKDTVEEWGLDSEFEFKKAPLKIINKISGSEFLFKGMDKPGKAKSIKDPNCAFFEELDELEEEDWRQTILSLRGKPPIRWFAAMNPPTPDHWVVKNFLSNYRDFEQEDGMFTYVKSTRPDTLVMHSNYLMTPHAKFNKVLMDEMTWLKENDQEKYRVSGLGLIGNILTGLEFFDYFSRKVHVVNNSFNPDLPVHVTFDFNNLPYGTCLVIQVTQEGETTKVRLIDEICPSPPRNSIEDISEEFEYRYPNTREFYFYGDPSGGAAHQKKSRTEARDYIDQIQRSFSKHIHNDSKRVIRKAPPKAGRRIAWKKILSGDFNIVFEIDEKCKYSIKDLERLLIGDDGGWLKKHVTNKETKQRYEEMGHCADALTYFFCKIAHSLFYT